MGKGFKEKYRPNIHPTIPTLPRPPTRRVTASIEPLSVSLTETKFLKHGVRKYNQKIEKYSHIAHHRITLAPPAPHHIIYCSRDPKWVLYLLATFAMPFFHIIEN